MTAQETTPYDAPAVDAKVLARTVSEITGTRPRLSAEQRRDRDAWLERHALEQEILAHDRRINLERDRAVAAATEEQEAARVREKAQRKRAKAIDREVRRREMRDVRFALTQHQAWQRDIENAARNAARQQELNAEMQRRETLLADLNRTINPPQPPEPTVVYVRDDGDDLGSPNIADENFNPRYWMQKPIFKR